MQEVMVLVMVVCVGITTGGRSGAQGVMEYVVEVKDSSESEGGVGGVDGGGNSGIKSASGYIIKLFYCNCGTFLSYFRIILPFHCTPANSKTMLNPY